MQARPWETVATFFRSLTAPVTSFSPGLIFSSNALHQFAQPLRMTTQVEQRSPSPIPFDFCLGFDSPDSQTPTPDLRIWFSRALPVHHCGLCNSRLREIGRA